MKKKLLMPDYWIIPYQIYADRKLSPIDKFIYGAIYWFASMGNKKCLASNKVLAEVLKTIPSTVTNGLENLEARGYIKRLFLDDSRCRRTEIIPLVLMGKKLQKNPDIAKGNAFPDAKGNAFPDAKGNAFDTKGNTFDAKGNDLPHKIEKKTPKKALNEEKNKKTSKKQQRHLPWRIVR